MNKSIKPFEYPIYLAPFFEFKSRIEEWMPTDLTLNEIREAFRRYDAAIRPNYIPWTAVALIRHPGLQRLNKAVHWATEPTAEQLGQLFGYTSPKVSSGDTTFLQRPGYVASYLSLDSQTELSGRQTLAHPTMLMWFMREVNCLADSRHTIFVHETVAPIYSYVGSKGSGATHHSSFPALAVLTALELASEVYIPVLTDWMLQLNPKADMAYIDTLVRSWIELSTLLLEAVAESYEIEVVTEAEMEYAIGLVEELLRQIFLGCTRFPNNIKLVTG